MITVDWMICARGTSIDRETGALTLFGIIDGISVLSFPLILHDFNVAIAMRRESSDPESVSARLRILQAGTQIVDGEVDAIFQGKLRATALLEINGLILVKPGPLELELRFNGDLKSRTSFEVTGGHPSLKEREVKTVEGILAR